MVLGSGKQRNALDRPPAQAIALLKKGLQELAPFAESAGVKILIEPLPPKDYQCYQYTSGSKSIHFRNRKSGYIRHV